MPAAIRPYVVLDKHSQTKRLIRASSPSAALNHIYVTRFDVHPARGAEVADLMEAGILIETASSKSADDTTADIFEPENGRAAA